ncbi:MAG: AAA family ATPase [Veillonellales bacterium]
MRLREIILKNFRSYEKETKIDIDDLTAFTGKNDIGKSTVLEALEVFFNGSIVKLDRVYCFHCICRIDGRFTIKGN